MDPSKLRKRNHDLDPLKTDATLEMNHEKPEVKMEASKCKSDRISSWSSSWTATPRYLLFFLLFSTTFLLIFHAHFPLSHGDGLGVRNAISHTVVFDAGSTGTRIHVFQFERRKHQPKP